MSEIASGVFDLVVPSPVTLQELSSIAVAIDVWRHEIGKYRENGISLHELPKSITTLKDPIPNMPSSILSLINQHVKTLGISIYHWKWQHSFQKINLHEIRYVKYDIFSDRPSVLNDFDNFACDFDGSIDCVRTAKRMMFCDKLTNYHKFKIACEYCLEDDINRLWPMVSHEIDLDKIRGDRTLYYWVCRLINEMFGIPVHARVFSIEEQMLREYKIHNWSSVGYFWNRLNFESQWRIAVKMIHNPATSLLICGVDILGRYLLPKLDELFVDKLINGSELIQFLFRLEGNKRRYIMPIWMFIKNRINESNFINLIKLCLQDNFLLHSPDSEYYPAGVLYCEIWEITPDDLKRSVIQSLILDDGNRWWLSVFAVQQRDITFLSRILSYVSLEERNKFWGKKWIHLIEGVHSSSLQKLMNQCFENENQIIEFKTNVMSKYINIAPYLAELLADCCLEEIDDFLTFCCSDTKTRRNLKRQLLESNLLGEDSVLSHYHFGLRYSLTDFINDAYGGADLAVDFKSMLMNSPVIMECLKESIDSYNFSGTLELIEMLIFSESLTASFKDEFLNRLKEKLVKSSIWSYIAEYLQKILFWCLGSEEKIAEFKKSLHVEEIFQNMVRKEIPRRLDEMEPRWANVFRKIHDANSSTKEAVNLVRKYPRDLDQFLNWYFDTPEDIAEFKRKFSDIFATFYTEE